MKTMNSFKEYGGSNKIYERISKHLKNKVEISSSHEQKMGASDNSGCDYKHVSITSSNNGMGY
jgi:hypothetical protein